MAHPDHVVAARRARLVRRHVLDGSGASVPAAAGAVVALHATDPATVYLSVLARCRDLSLDDVAEALYSDRALVRLLAMRRTLFAVPRDAVPVVHAAASRAVAATLRRTLVRQLCRLPTEPPLPTSAAGVEAWLDDTLATTAAELAKRGEATGAELGAAVPPLRTAILPTTTKRYDVRRTVTTQVLTLLAAEGHAVRHRPRGSWTSRRHTWQPASAWWPDGLPEVPEADARAALVAAYLRAFGPASERDIAWWTGWAKGVTRRALAALELAETPGGLVLADDTVEETAQAPRAALLPALDPTPMGWKERDWFLPPDSTALFDGNGNIGPTVWWGGEIVGGWAVRPDGTIATRLLVDRGRAAERGVAEVAAQLEPRLAGTAVVPSFPTPLERTLRGG